MELIMEIILGIVSIILGTALFWRLNSMFSITYFGLVLWLVFGEVHFVVSLLIIGGIGKLLLGVLKWIIIIGIILAIVGFVASKVNGNQE